jgi:hypothetical protein
MHVIVQRPAHSASLLLSSCSRTKYAGPPGLTNVRDHVSNITLVGKYSVPSDLLVVLFCELMI